MFRLRWWAEACSEGVEGGGGGGGGMNIRAEEAVVRRWVLCGGVSGVGWWGWGGSDGMGGEWEGRT